MLKISFASPQVKPLNVWVVFVAAKAKLAPLAAHIDQRLEGALSRALKATGSFSGQKGQSLLLPAPSAKGPDKLFLIGTGEEAKLDALALEEIGAALAIALAHEPAASVFIETLSLGKNSAAEAAALIAHGAQLRAYRFDAFKSAPKKDQPNAPHLAALSFKLEAASSAKKTFAALEAVAEGALMARDLGNMPANLLTPAALAAEAKKLAKLGVKVRVLTETQMKALGMGSLLGVAQGSAQKPRLVSLEWNGAPKGKKTQPLALVGKGVTFDSGGISLKPAGGMEEMKFDMMGAAAVIGTMRALAGRKAKAHVVGLVGLVENMPSGAAQRPGDVVRSASGQTIEVLNTDAEGRLVLADVLWYAQKTFKPKAVIDLATLTGAIVIALGHEYAGLFANDDKLAAQLEQAGTDVGEKLWRMPLCPSFDKMMDSQIADMRNISGVRDAGSCTAAQFLGRFIEKDVAWAHLDIAGTAWGDKNVKLAPKTSPSGFGVRLLNRLIAANFEA